MRVCVCRLCLCLRLRRRRQMSIEERPGLPALDEAIRLSDWLAGPRGRLLRRAQIALRRRVLEIGCGHGNVTAELQRRSDAAGGLVIGLDKDAGPARRSGIFTGPLVQADATALPFPDRCFDLVLCQNALLWIADLDRSMAETARVLAPGGLLVAIEPDYGGMLEFPPEISLRDLWLDGLLAAGADPQVGRKLPGAAERVGLHVRVELQNIPCPPNSDGARLLMGLHLDPQSRRRVASVANQLDHTRGNWQAFVHVPYVLVEARKPA